VHDWLFQGRVNEMFYALLYVSAVCFSFFVVVYGSYYFFVFKTRKKAEYFRLIEKILEKDLDIQEFPFVSVLIPAFNEEDAISRKLENISALDYPREKLEVILIDDCSTDNTVEIAQRMLDKLGFTSKIIKNRERKGVNAAYNIGVTESKGDLILTTDSDVLLDSDALIKGVKILKELKDVGGISGKMVPVSSDSTVAVSIEKPYRSFYDSMLTAESAIYSTFPAYTCYTLLRKSVFLPLPLHYGSSDGNISLATIKKGFKFLFIPHIPFYEPILSGISEQRKQKIRRATRLIQSTLANKDIMFKSKFESFGKVIFPLRFTMMVIAPFSFFIGLITAFLVMLQLSMAITLLVIFLFSLFVLLGAKTDLPLLSALNSFIVHEFYLLIGVLMSQRRVSVWRPAVRSKMGHK